MFKTKLTLVCTTAFTLLLRPLPAPAQDAGALLDLLVKKRIITDQEAEEVRAELTKDTSSTSAGKLKLSNPIPELEIYGDARVRYEIRTAETGSPDTINRPGDHSQRNR